MRHPSGSGHGAVPDEERLDEGRFDLALKTWLGAIGRGDTDALALVYGQTSPKLLGILRRLLGRRDLAEELLHDVYLRVWDRAASFDPARGTAMAWLVTIARNAALDQIRRSGREVPAEDNPGLAERADPLDLAAASQARRALEDCLGRLEEEPRRCVLWAYHEGLTYDELARRTGRPVNTVKSWVSRSLQRLRACLEGE